MSTRIRSLSAATAAVIAVTLLSGCSLISGGSPAVSSPAKAAPAKAQPATSSPEASATPALRKVAAVSQDVDGIQLRQLVGKGALLIDVRPRHDFDKEHIKGAISIPMRIFASKAASWSQVRPVVVYGRTGADAQTAQTWLEKHGFMEVYHLYRGIEGYDDTLAGTSPTPIPAKRPVLYYFYDAGSEQFQASDEVVASIRKEFPGQFEYHAYNIQTVDGKAQYLESGYEVTPTLRLIDEHGRTELYQDVNDLPILRAHLKRAIEAYEQSIGS